MTTESEPLCICDSSPPLHDQENCPAALAELENELSKRGVNWCAEHEQFEAAHDD